MARLSLGRRRAVALLALTSVLLITLDLQGSPVIDGARRTFGAVFAPLEDAARVVTRPIGNAWRGISDYDDVRRENEALREQLDQQQGAFIAALASVRDAQELLALNGIANLANIESCTAQVIGQSPTNFSQTVELNRGEDCGLKIGMPVVNAAGLVGKVTRVFPNRSVVMLATDPEYAVTVKIVNPPAVSPTTTTTTLPSTDPGSTPPTSNPGTTTTTPTTTTPPGPPVLQPDPTPAPLPALPGDPLAPAQLQTTTTIDLDQLPARETGAFRGRGPGVPPVVEFIDPSARFGPIDVGALVLTAGGSTSLSPADIVVGTVVRKVERAGSAGPLLEVRLSASLSNLNFVRVLRFQPTSELGG
ncbi:MAG: rod shape-determining protein MreC [Ilumatobacteraceae bacterium]